MTTSPSHPTVTRFGDRSDDLNLDFHDLARPQVVTDLLCRHLEFEGGPYENSSIWGWTIQRRLRWLAAIACATLGPQARVEVRCNHEDCGEFLELDLDVRTVCKEADADPLSCTPEPGVEVRLRRPTGEDQQDWLDMPAGDHANAYASMAASLVTSVGGEPPAPGWEIPGTWIDPIGETLERHDPFTLLTLQADCVGCRRRLSIDFDLESFLLQALFSVQQEKLDDVHRLASAYHWSEAEILELSPQRRAHYLARVRAETDP